MSAVSRQALTGMSAIVTGGAGGIGGASARRLLRDGARVVLIGRTESTLAARAEELRDDTGGQVRYVVGDALEPESILAGVELAEALGRFTMCVNVPGGGYAPILAKEDDVFLGEVGSSVMPPFIAIKYTAPALVRAGGGSIVCISSTAGHMPMAYHVGYCTGKAGVEMLIRVAAEELGPLQVRVNAVRPGLTRTREMPIFADPEILRQWVDEKPLGRYGEPDDVAAGVRFLAGPESSWLTGQSFAIDGGHELRKYQRADALPRQQLGEAAFEAAMAGRIPATPQKIRDYVGRSRPRVLWPRQVAGRKLGTVPHPGRSVKVTTTGSPMRTSSGRTPTKSANTRRPGCSTRSTQPTGMGGLPSKPGTKLRWTTVKVHTVPRPLTSSNRRLRERQAGHRLSGKWFQRRHCRQRWISSRPCRAASQYGADSGDGSVTGGPVAGRGSDIYPSCRVRMAALPKLPLNPVQRAVEAAGTWRSPASCRSCTTASTTLLSPCTYPSDSRPPLVLTGRRPVGPHPPSRISAAASRGPTKPKSSSWRSTTQVYAS